MKVTFLKLNGILLFMSFILFISCDETKDEFLSEAAIDSDNILSVEEVDVVIEEINNTVEQVFVEEEIGLAQSRGGNTLSYFPDCLVKTVVITDDTKEITLDFGDGCEVRGKFIAGVLRLSYEKESKLNSRTILVNYDNFRINQKLIEGTFQVVRIKENENSNPESKATFEIDITWDNGDVASRMGYKNREWIEGAGSGNWRDNVYLITGEWETTRRNNNVIIGFVSTPLRRELSCEYLVSGILNLTKNNRTVILDFGDGDCDNLANLILDDGTIIEMTLP